MNTDKIRADFPIIEKKKLVYLDSACVSLKPKQVVEAINSYYNEFPACAGRSNHSLGQKVTEKVAEARAAIAKFFNAKSPKEIIFTRNTTEAINIVANAFQFNKDGSSIVLTTDKEHNSNLIPWLKLAKEGKLKHKVIPSNSDGAFNLETFEQMLKKDKPTLVSVIFTSNLDGVTNPIKEITKLAHKAGAKVLVDAAQAAGHREIDVRDLEVDFLACSGHKMLGPSGIGALYGKESELQKLSQFMTGGETVKDSTYTSYEVEDIPERFEAGLQDYAGIIGFAEATRYLSKIGLKEIEQHCIKLNKLLTRELEGQPIHIIGPKDAEKRGSILSFYSDKINHHEIALLLNSNNIMARSGAFCVHSWFNAHKVKGAVRLSFHVYNNEDDVKKAADWLKQILKI
jgi:cysteine desulfurase/selenocysteine lyase